MLNNVASIGALAAGYFGLATVSLNEFLLRPDIPPILEIHALAAFRDGDTARIEYDRTISREGDMTYSVRVMERGTNGMSQYCAMDLGPIHYSPEAELPEMIDLAWWTNGECSELPAGRAEIWTTWQEQGQQPMTVITPVRE